MAKSQERGIVHVKDVFGRSEPPRQIGHSGAQQTNERTKTHDSNKPYIGSNGEVIFKKPDNSGNKPSNRGGNTSWAPSDHGYGMTKTFGTTQKFGTKRQAPLPPSVKPTKPNDAAHRERQAGNVSNKNFGRETPAANNLAKQPGLRDKPGVKSANSANTKDSAHLAGRSQLGPTPTHHQQTSPAFRHTQTAAKAGSSQASSPVTNGVASVANTNTNTNNKYRPKVNVNVNGYMNPQSQSPTRKTNGITNQTKDASKPSSGGSAVYTANSAGVKKQVYSNGVPSRTARQSSGSETGSSGYHSESLELPNGMKGVKARPDSGTASDFWEDEATIDLGEEEDARIAQGKKTRVYKDYDGDDFAQYLKDDTCEYEYPTERRNYRKNTSKTHISPPMSPSTLERQQQNKKAGLKDKLSSVFTLSKSDAKRRYYKNVRNGTTSIHNFTFSDTKMGLSLDNPETGSPPADIQSDIGGYATSGGSWWGKDTLSARSLISRSEMGGRSSKSMTDLVTQSNGNLQHYSTMPEPGSEKKKSNNIFRKMSRTLRRKKAPHLGEQELSLAPMVEDTRL